ncbi:MAG: hypothetical protein ACRCVT_05200 [Leadbetterella sp.]
MENTIPFVIYKNKIWDGSKYINQPAEIQEYAKQKGWNIEKVASLNELDIEKINQIHFSGASMTDLPNVILKFNSLEYLDISESDISEPKKIEPNSTTVNIFNTDDLNAHKFPKIKTLCLDGTSIASLDFLEHLTRLECITLKRCPNLPQGYIKDRLQSNYILKFLDLR